MVQYSRAFAGLFLRDLHVLRREMNPFIDPGVHEPAAVPVCVYVHHAAHERRRGDEPDGGDAGPNFSTVLLPGLMAVAIMFSGIAAVALPLAQEFGITREIDDRVMCPLPVAAVAIEKICFSAVQSMIAAAVVFPLAYYVPATPVYAHVASWPFLILVMGLASLTSGALGLVIGTSVKPQQIGLIFGVVVMPITFLGCVYYPWAQLKYIPWLQIGVLINPIVYMSEGLRVALTPSLEHMNPALILLMLSGFLVLLTILGVQGFLRRVIG